MTTREVGLRFVIEFFKVYAQTFVGFLKALVHPTIHGLPQTVDLCIACLPLLEHGFGSFAQRTVVIEILVFVHRFKKVSGQGILGIQRFGRRNGRFVFLGFLNGPLFLFVNGFLGLFQLFGVFLPSLERLLGQVGLLPSLVLFLEMGFKRHIVFSNQMIALESSRSGCTALAPTLPSQHGFANVNAPIVDDLYLLYGITRRFENFRHGITQKVVADVPEV